MKDFTINLTGALTLLAQASGAPTDLNSFMPLVEKFGTWIIWFAIALYLFKRQEKRDEADAKKRDEVDAARQKVQEAMLAALTNQGVTLVNQNSILVEQSRQLDKMSDALKKNPCINFKPN